MADNLTTQSATPATVPASSVISTEEVSTLNGGAVTAQHVQRVAAAIRTADGTAIDLAGDAANGLDVDVTRVAGTVAVSGPLTDTQLRASAVPISGTVTANISGSISNSGFTVTNGSGASAVNVQDGGNSITVDGTTTANQGSPASTVNAWPIRVTNGSNVVSVMAGSPPGSSDPALVVALSPNTNYAANSQYISVTDRVYTAAVKNASTAAVATDPALVVAVSPNNAVAVTDGGGSITIDGAVTVGNTVTIQDGGNQITVDGNVTVGNASGVNAVNIQDGGNSITVDGSVSAAISGSISNTSFGVNNGVGASAVNIQDGGNSITVDGPVTVNNGSGGGAVNIQDGGNSITVDGPLTDTQMRASAVPVDTELPAAAALGDTDGNPTAPGVGGFLMLWNGAAWQRARVPIIFKTVALTAATAETTVWTPGSNKKFRVMGMFLNAGAATTLTFKDNTAGTTIIEGYASATAAENLNFGGMGGILSAAANNVLTVTRGSSAALYGMIWGTEE